MHQVPLFEQMLVDSGITLTKFWFSVTQSEQRTRFIIRQIDPVRQWKLSPIDLQSLDKWDAYTAAKEEMFRRTDTDWAPWTTIKLQRQEARPPQRDALLPRQPRLRREGPRRRRHSRPPHRPARHRRRRRLKDQPGHEMCPRCASIRSSSAPASSSVNGRTDSYAATNAPRTSAGVGRQRW